MKELFETEELKIKQKKEKCKNCKYIFYKEYNVKKIFYCSKRSSNRTENGYLKIKYNQLSCDYFKEKL